MQQRDWYPVVVIVESNAETPIIQEEPSTFGNPRRQRVFENVAPPADDTRIRTSSPLRRRAEWKEISAVTTESKMSVVVTVTPKIGPRATSNGTDSITTSKTSSQPSSTRPRRSSSAQNRSHHSHRSPDSRRCSHSHGGVAHTPQRRSADGRR